MTTIAIRLDTQNLVKQLRAKGFADEQASAIVETIKEASDATEKAVESRFQEYESVFKKDFEHLESVITARNAESKYDILKWMIPLVLGLYALLISKLF